MPEEEKCWAVKFPRPVAGSSYHSSIAGVGKKTTWDVRKKMQEGVRMKLFFLEFKRSWDETRSKSSSSQAPGSST